MGAANYIKIQHVDGTIANYFRLTDNGVLVSAGDLIAQGTPIALSGKTGARGPHLHFEVQTIDEKDSIPVTSPIPLPMFVDSNPARRTWRIERGGRWLSVRGDQPRTTRRTSVSGQVTNTLVSLEA